MSFSVFYNWLKYTVVTPSFFFKNRLFIEKTMQSRNIYADFSETSKSFTWSQLSSSNLDAFWFRASRSRFKLYILIFITLSTYVFIKWINVVDTPVFPAGQFLHYAFWRVMDSFYFIMIQTQYLILTTLVWTIFAILNVSSSANLSLVRWMEKYHAETPMDIQHSIYDNMDLNNDRIKYIHHILRLRTLMSTRESAVSSGNVGLNLSHQTKSPDPQFLLNTLKNFYYLTVCISAPKLSSLKISVPAYCSSSQFLLMMNKSLLQNHGRCSPVKWESFYNLRALGVKTVSAPSILIHKAAPFCYTSTLVSAYDDSLLKLSKVVRWTSFYNTLHRRDVDLLKTLYSLPVEKTLTTHPLNTSVSKAPNTSALSFEWVLRRLSLLMTPLDAFSASSHSQLSLTPPVQTALSNPRIAEKDSLKLVIVSKFIQLPLYDSSHSSDNRLAFTQLDTSLAGYMHHTDFLYIISQIISVNDPVLLLSRPMNFDLQTTRSGVVLTPSRL